MKALKDRSLQRRNFFKSMGFHVIAFLGGCFTLGAAEGKQKHVRLLAGNAERGKLRACELHSGACLTGGGTKTSCNPHGGPCSSGWHVCLNHTGYCSSEVYCQGHHPCGQGVHTGGQNRRKPKAKS